LRQGQVIHSKTKDNEPMRFSFLPVILTLTLVASCGDIASERAVVEHTGPDDLLKLRSGPGLGFNVILGLPDGTVLNQQGCVTEVGQRWCQVSLADAPQMRGYVSADYLSAR
jgi:uncharacterized protein YraI